MNDPTTIARFCWPEYGEWAEYGDGAEHPNGRLFHPLGLDGYEYWQDVREAERIVIERGLAKEYGLALCERCQDINGWTYDGECWESDLAHAATAPIETRVAAIADAIRRRAV